MPNHKTTTIGEYFKFMAGSAWRRDVLDWPPDVFCMVASLLQRTGGYIKLLSNWPPTPYRIKKSRRRLKHTKPLLDWTSFIRDVGSEWWLHASRRAGSETSKPPEAVSRWWDIVYAAKDRELFELETKLEKSTHDRLWQALLQLCAAADEACVDIGFSEESSHGGRLRRAKKPLPKEDMLWHASTQVLRLGRNKHPTTLTRHIRPSLAVVLPKLHTPQSGITLRSISHHLAFLRSCEVKPVFAVSEASLETKDPSTGRSPNSLNLLLVPWPTRVTPGDFRSKENEREKMPSQFGFFSFEPKGRRAPEESAAHLKTVLRTACRNLGTVDGVVFPEMAFRSVERASIFNLIRKECGDAFMVAGIRSSPKNDYATNQAIFQWTIGKVPDEVVQDKHHRWQLERAQIGHYGLGGRLDPRRRWWEHIGIKPRHLSFMSISDEITASVLICEDLARQEPIADMIRAVGPTLVIALLMDGPQLGSRWPAHYATVLADDPGSSVLTLTSIGMAELSRPPDTPPSRVIGLWKDRFQGLRKIELEGGADAVVLSLNTEKLTEYTADGRADRGGSTFLKLNGIHQVRTSKSRW